MSRFKQSNRRGFIMRLRAWLQHHFFASATSFSRLVKSPLASIITLLVISIALALPTGLFVLFNNVRAIGHGFDNMAQLSLYLQADTSVSQARALVQSLSRNPKVGEVRLITPSQGLAELQQQLDVKPIVNALGKNPLPMVIVVHPVRNIGDPSVLQAMRAQLKEYPLVDEVRVDMQWVKRFYAMLAIAQRIVVLLASFLGLAVLLVIGNTIRLNTHKHKEEIEVEKLIGATDAFIRRPFLYTGMWYGLIGSLLAWCFVCSGLWLLKQPISYLANLYSSHFQLQMLGAKASISLLVAGIVLGFVGAWLAVNREMRLIEPH